MTLPAGLHDWNAAAAPAAVPVAELNDETLRDGLQSPSAIDPPADAKLRLLHLMVELGIEAATIGFPATGPRMLRQCRALAQEAASQRLPIALNCVARTLVADVEPVAALQQEIGVPIEAGIFIGGSPARQAAEGWTLDEMRRRVAETVAFAVQRGVAVMFVAEDASRTPPATLEALFGEAVAAGARRLVLTDTTGHATPEGTRALVRWVRSELPFGASVRLDWHGHRDRGLAIANSLAAIEAGVDRVHATALGVGERSGNTEMDQLLVNLRLMGRARGDLTRLPEYCKLVSHAIGVRIPANYPVVGFDAFRTGTGIHASAILKAQAQGDAVLADIMYSGVPASLFGLRQRVDVSPMSGRANVRHWLATHGYDADDVHLQQSLLNAAKRADRALSDEECEFAVRGTGKGRGHDGN